MTKNEQRQAVLAEWRTWQRARPDRGTTGTDAMLFHSYLQAEQPHPLVGINGDSWRAIHGFLLTAREVTD